MQAAFKGAIFALLLAVVARTAAGACTAERNDVSSLPFSVKYTTSGTDASTSVVMTVCSTGCAPGSDLCSPVARLSVGSSVGVTASPSAAADDCGLSFPAASLGSLATDDPAGPEHCEALYLNADKAGATLEDVCPNGCPFVVELQNGVTVGATIGGGEIVTPSETTDVDTTTDSEDGESSSDGSSSGSSGSDSDSGPSPYGPTPYRRRMQQTGASNRRRVNLGRRL